MKIKIALIASFIILLTGCVDSAAVRYGDSGRSTYKSGPPPHAPAHGYRHKHHKHDMSYDSGLGAYIVLGKREVYFDDGLYFRYRSGDWQASVNLGNGWYDTNKKVVPHKLWSYKDRDYKHAKQKSHRGKGHNKGKGKNHRD
ncbi:MAG: hypothetical protein HRT92_09185 [Piscirickettsiaceae bacterium]|nr:hypothetical protein [Piscirickettsiaceae bacterium]